MASTAADAVKVAASQIGTVERPANSNKTPYGAWYGWNGVPWCDIFVSWVGNKAGCLAEYGGKYAYTVYHANWFKNRKQWHGAPKVGDIVFFDWGNKRAGIQHVGIVEKIINSSTIQTIEGNTTKGTAGNQSNGGGVFRRLRSMSQVAGFGRPKYAASKPKPAPKPAGTTVKRILKRGMTGSDVKALQSALKAKGYAVGKAGADGVFGKDTDAAVRKYQKAKKLQVDGHAGKKTLGALGIKHTLK